MTCCQVIIVFWRQRTSDLGSAVVNKNELTMMMMKMMITMETRMIMMDMMMLMMEMFACRKIPMFLIKLSW